MNPKNSFGIVENEEIQLMKNKILDLKENDEMKLKLEKRYKVQKNLK